MYPELAQNTAADKYAMPLQTDGLAYSEPNNTTLVVFMSAEQPPAGTTQALCVQTLTVSGSAFLDLVQVNAYLTIVSV